LHALPDSLQCGVEAVGRNGAKRQPQRMRYLLRRRKRLCLGHGDAILLQRHGDAVGSSIRTRDVVSDPALMARLALDPSRQLVGHSAPGR